MSFSILADALEVVRMAETTIAGEAESRRKSGRFWLLARSLEVIRTGMAGFLNPAVKFLAYWFCGLIFASAAAWAFSLATTDANALKIFGGLFSFVIVAFALPSSYVADALSHAHVAEMVSRVRRHAPFSVDEIDALLSTVDEFHNRVLARISAFQWVMAASWALATYLFSQYTGIALKLLPAANLPQQIFNASVQLGLFAALSLFMLWGIFGYKRGIDRTFRLCRLSLRQLQIEATLESSAKEATKSAAVAIPTLAD